jgi:hypothetical protein
MKIRICVLYAQEGPEPEPPLLCEMRSPPTAGDLLDTRRYGPCEVVDVVSTPADPNHDAVIHLKIRAPSR